MTCDEPAAGDDESDESRGPTVTDRPRTLASGFDAIAAAYPDAVAVEVGDVAVTYRWLEAESARFASRLLEVGAAPDRPVALLLAHSLSFVVCAVAAARLGVPYLPIDVRTPPHRIATMLEDARAAIVVAQEPLPFDVPTLTPAHLRAAGAVRSMPVAAIAPAYIIFTSGSTGRPKGVCVHHEGIAAFTNWMRRTHGLGPAHRVPLLANLAFDAAVLEAWSALTSGAALVIGSPDQLLDSRALWAALTERQCTAVFLTTPVAEGLLADISGGSAGSVTVIWTGGDRLRAMPASDTPVEIWNLYGPTEVSVASTGILLERGGDRLPTVGWPVDDLHVFVVDEAWNEVFRGARGELWVGGVGVAIGYVGDPVKTADRFVPDFDSDVDGARAYRTGDRVRWTPRAGLSFEGRTDDQVKVRGQRVEIGEVEHAMRRMPGIADAVVVARGGPRGIELHGYFVGAADDLRGSLRSVLPDFMIPSSIQSIEKVPLTSRGKVDRAALPIPQRTREASQRPSGLLEEAVADAFRAVLGVDDVARDDNFFDLGGHSLLAIRLVSRLRFDLNIELPIRDVFAAPTVRDLAARLVEPGARSPSAYRSLGRRPAGTPLELSWAQERMWFLHRLSPDSGAYNMPVAVWLDGDLDLDALERSIAIVEARHESLRTVVADVAGEPIARLLPPGSFGVRRRDVTAGGNVDDEAMDLFRAFAVAPFSLSEGPLLRAVVVRVSKRRHLFGIVLHHIASDGWSQSLMIREFAHAYAALIGGAAPDLAGLPIQYGDFAWWQRRWFAGGELERQLAYWKAQLAGATTVLELPTDRPRPAMSTGPACTVPVRIAAAVAAVVRDLAQREGATLFIVLLAAFQALLSRYARTDDLIVGTPVANRGRRELEGLVGVFVNTLALRSDLSGEPTFRELVARTKATALGAYDHQDLPFERLVDALGLPRDLSRSPLVQVMFAFHNFERTTLELPGLTIESVASSGAAVQAKFDLQLTLGEQDDEIVGTLTYAADLFERATAERMASQLETLLGALVQAPELRVDEASATSALELETLRGWNGTATRYDGATTIPGAFLEQVERTPHAVAVSFGDSYLSYGALERRSRGVARRLLEEGVNAEARVGVCSRRSLELLVALTGVMMAGAAYVPLDPSYPTERLAWMVEDGAVDVVLVEPGLESRLPSCRRISLDEMFEAGTFRPPALPERALAYVIFTSGSTGRPKGAMNEHRSVMNRLRWQHEAFPLNAGERVLQKTPYSFDVSVWELFSPILVGGTVVMAEPGAEKDPSSLSRLLVGRQISVVHFVPSMLRAFLDEEGSELGSVHTVLASGEALPADVAARFRRTHAAMLENLYGPTEAAVEVTRHRCQGEAPGGRIPIGRPIANTTLWATREATPTGVVMPGELMIGGVQVGRGYIGRPDLTADRFGPDPFDVGGRAYRTGDLGRWLPSGTIEYLGRVDHQVKIRGLRIELEEVDAALRRVAGVAAGAAAVQPSPRGEPTLVGYVVAAGKDAPFDAAALERQLECFLPEYMVPRTWVCLDRLPLTPSGKLDRRALPGPALESHGGGAAPVGPVESRLASMFAELLDARDVSRDHSFFELGGHSLIAIRLLARVASELGVEIPLRAIFDAPRVKDLASRVATARETAAPRGLPRLHTLLTGQGPSVVVVHGFDGRTLILEHLVGRLPAGAVHSLEIGTHDLDLDALVAADLAELGPGPHVLLGWSLGAVLASELVRRAAPGVVAAAVLLDPHIIAASSEATRDGGMPADEQTQRVREAMRRAAAGVQNDVELSVPTLVLAAGDAPADTRLRVHGPYVTQLILPVSHWGMLTDDVTRTAAAVTSWLSQAVR